MGRPKKKNPKSKQLRLRLTEEEYAWIKTVSEECGCTMTRLLKHGFWNIASKFCSDDIQVFASKVDAMMKGE